VIATDHGFILIHDQKAGNVAQKPAGNWLIQKLRWLLGKGAGGGGSVSRRAGAARLAVAHYRQA
jgi:hypothetical protein